MEFTCIVMRMVLDLYMEIEWRPGAWLSKIWWEQVGIDLVG